MNNKCSICGTKSGRLCLATGRMICTLCCGSKRGNQITCSAECRYYPFSIAGYDSWLRIDATLTDKIVDYIISNYGRDKFRDIIDRMKYDSENAEEMEATATGSAAYYVLFVERDSENKTLAEKWRNEGWPGLNNDECKMMECRINNSYVTIVEIHRVLDRQAMECIDLFDEERRKFIVLDRSTASRATRFTRLLTWLVHYPHFSRLANNGAEIPDLIFLEFKEILADKFKKEKFGKDLTVKEYLSEGFGSFCKLTRELIHEKHISILNSMDMHQCKAFYEILETKFDKVKAILDKYPDFETRERHNDELDFPGAYYYSWLRRGESKELEKEMLPAFQHGAESEGVGTIGNVSLYPNQLIIETFSKQKYAFARKMVDKYFEGMVTLKNEKVVDMGKQMAERIEEGRENLRPSKDPSEVPLEIQQKLMKDFYKKRYERFLDEEVPALDGMTPRQAARIPAMRYKLLDLMKLHLRGIERHNRQRDLGLDITWVLDELQLSELK